MHRIGFIIPIRPDVKVLDGAMGDIRRTWCIVVRCCSDTVPLQHCMACQFSAVVALEVAPGSSRCLTTLQHQDVYTVLCVLCLSYKNGYTVYRMYDDTVYRVFMMYTIYL